MCNKRTHILAAPNKLYQAST